MKNITDQTLATIVTNNHSTVPVLEKYHLDFCCKGKRTLAQACSEKGLPLETIAMELELATTKETQNKIPFTAMSDEEIISYILIHHHFYVKQSLPAIMAHLEKVASKHGDRYPYMIEVLMLFKAINDDMLSHMNKEEMVLFPRIKQLAAITEAHQAREFAEGYISGPIEVMEHEHDHAGSILYNIRQLTNSYTPPADACTTMQVTFAELKEFEEDLHRHVHLENNILFPMAENMMKQQFSVN